MPGSRRTNPSSITADNMKTLLLTLVIVAVAHASSGKVKRDILPGDPRYGTDYHHHHHHAHSSTDDLKQYLPPFEQQSNPQPSNQYLTPLAKTETKQTFELPSTSYGVPFKSELQVPTTSYGTPLKTVEQVAQPQHVEQHVEQQVYQAPVAVPHTTYGAPSRQVHQVQQAVEPTTVYGVPEQQHQVHQAHQIPQVYVAPVQVNRQANHQVHHQVHHQVYNQVHQVRQQPTQVYGAPVQRHQAQFYQPTTSYGVPVQRYQAAQPVREKLVFEAPIQSIEVAHTHSVEAAPAPVQISNDAVSVDAVGTRGSSSGYTYNQPTGSNGGYVY